MKSYTQKQRNAIKKLRKAIDACDEAGLKLHIMDSGGWGSMFVYPQKEFKKLDDELGGGDLFGVLNKLIDFYGEDCRISGCEMDGGAW